jgi:predicted alpha-1,6-mannanase (GH76 family)
LIILKERSKKKKMMRRVMISMLLLPSFIGCDKIKDTPPESNTHTVNWTFAADSSSSRLVNYFWNTQGKYFNKNNSGDLTFNYWPQAHALDVLVDAYTRTHDNMYLSYMSQWYDGVKQKNGGSFLNNFYDDMEWNALAMLRAYNVTQDEKFKTAVYDVWNDIKTGWNTTAGGGIAWQKGQLYYKNTPANAPACILAARLYQQFNNQSDLEWANKIYQWLKDNLYEGGMGFVYDGMNRNQDGQKDNWAFTYNQGTFIGSALELYKITKESVYLYDAVKAADYTLNAEANSSDRLLKDEGSGDGGLFKGIFIRYFTQLILLPDLSESTRKRYITFFKLNAETLWLDGTNKAIVLFGTYWKTKPGTQTDLTVQLSGAMLLEAAALLKNTNNL